MNKGLIAVAAGAFAFGFSEFVMMGMLPEVAAGMSVSVPWAGNFISSYAIGVCVGTLMLVFGRRVPPKRLIICFLVLSCAGNATAALAPSAGLLVAARFLSGLGHGSFFGTATIVAKELAEPGKEGKAVGIMVLGQTLANTVGVPGGTLLSNLVTWRAAFAFVSVWAACSAAYSAKVIPAVPSIPNAGLMGQFRFLGAPGPWLVLAGVLLGNAGLFCWWSYVSPWFVNEGGWPDAALPVLLFLAGVGMIFGSQVGGRLVDLIGAGRTAALAQLTAATVLALIFLLGGTMPTSLALGMLCSFALFFPGCAQQILMVQVGRGGGEMIGSACVQVAFNGGNAIGAQIGQLVLNTGVSYAWPSLAGAPLAMLASASLAVFFTRFERRYESEALGRAE